MPLFGDMQISLVNYVKQCPHFEGSKWTCAAENAEAKAGVNQYNLVNRMSQIHEEHLKIISELARYSNDVSLSPAFLLFSILVLLVLSMYYTFYQLHMLGRSCSVNCKR